MATRKIAILGGGVGALSTAWTLANLPNASERFAITVYQMGWRLGGKGASGRNAEYGSRIEEHGLHVWAGFYENAFRVMADAYDAQPKDAENPLPKWDDAFKKHDLWGLGEESDAGWVLWPVRTPQNDAVPGTGGEMPTRSQYVQLALDWMIERMEGDSDMHLIVSPDRAGTLGLLVDLIEVTIVRIADGIRSGHLWSHLFGGHHAPASGSPPLDLGNYSAADLLRSARRYHAALPADPAEHAPEHHANLLHFIEASRRRAHTVLNEGVGLSEDKRRLHDVLHLGYATIRGLIADGVPVHGFEAINDRDWREWMGRHGCPAPSLDSAFVRGIYDYVFGYRHGNSDNKQLEAGTAVHGIMRLLLTFKGSVFWEMQGGMGDIVFAPLYRALRERGVTFRFFHRVDRLTLSADASSVASIQITRQATPKNDRYEPLVRVKGLPCWPATPHYDQLVEGEALKGIPLESAWAKAHGTPQELRAGTDFDDVILGLSLDAVKNVCPDLMKANEKFRLMCEKIETVQTASMQLWLDRTGEELSGRNSQRIFSACEEYLSTWADMSFLIKREDWKPDAPGFIVYLCGQFPDADSIPPFSDTGFPARELARFREFATGWLERQAGTMWPGAMNVDGAKGFDWNLLHDPRGRSGMARLDAQYFRVNIDPTERYVLSVPGSSKYRLRPGESGFRNLWLAGDWVRTTINAGCVEAAVMSGMDAAASLSGDPVRIVGGLT